jgi:protein TonB
MKEPPRRAEAPGRDAITVPVLRPPNVESSSLVQKEPDPVAHVNIPAQDLSSALQSIRGAIDAPSVPPSNSQGPGDHDGSGTGDGPGDGPGKGSGLGPGKDGGVGDRAFQPGNDVTRPILVREVKPAYTSEAMRARLQGSVFLQCVVKPDGSVGDVKILHSLDPTFGLDLEAITAARQWRFQPGTRRGSPVPVVVTIQLEFSLR